MLPGTGAAQVVETVPQPSDISHPVQGDGAAGAGSPGVRIPVPEPVVGDGAGNPARNSSPVPSNLSAPVADIVTYQSVEETLSENHTFMDEARDIDARFTSLLQEFYLVELAQLPADARVPFDEEERNVHFTKAVRGAIQRHPSVQSGILSERQAERQVDAARSALYPQMGLSFQGDQPLIERPGTAGDNGFSPNAVLTIDQLLFDFGETFNRIDAAETRVQAQGFQATSQAQQFGLRAISAYFDVTRLQTLILLAEDNLAQHRLLLEQVDARAQSGIGRQADLMRARSRVADAEGELISVNGQYEQVLAQYQELFSAAPTHMELPEIDPIGDVMPRDIVARALDNNPAYRQTQAERVAAKFDSDAADASAWPSLSVEVSGTKYGVDHLGDDDHGVVGMLRVDYPLFTGGRVTAERERAELRYSQARSDEQSMRLQLEREVRAQLSDMAAMARRIRAQEMAVEAGRQTFSDYLELFLIGRKSLTDLLDAQQDLFEDALLLINTRVSLDVARYMILSLTGDLLRFFDVRELAVHE